MTNSDGSITLDLLGPPGTTIYQCDDGKIIVVRSSDGTNLINVVHADTGVAENMLEQIKKVYGVQR